LFFPRDKLEVVKLTISTTHFIAVGQFVFLEIAQKFSSKRMPKEKKKKLTAEEKEQKKIAKEQKTLRDHYEREFKFTKISHKRERNSLFRFAENETRKYFKDVVDEEAKNFSHQFDKCEHSIDVIATHRVHAAEQHLRIYKHQNDLMSDLIGECLE
jgi:hypothetical protein